MQNKYLVYFTSPPDCLPPLNLIMFLSQLIEHRFELFFSFFNFYSSFMKRKVCLRLEGKEAALASFDRLSVWNNIERESKALPLHSQTIFNSRQPDQNRLSTFQLSFASSVPLVMCTLSSLDKYSRLLLLTGFMFFYLYLTRKSCCVLKKLIRKVEKRQKKSIFNAYLPQIRFFRR